MKFFYHTCPVHDLGEFTVSQRRDAEGGPDSPQRIKVTTTLALTTFADGYAANANLLLAKLRAALQQQRAQVQWTDDNGQDYLDQTVTLISEDLPETWGTYTQHAEVVFYHYDAVTATNLANLPCSFTGSAGGQSGGKEYVLTNMLRSKRGDTSTRVSPLHSERRLSEERIPEL